MKRSQLHIQLDPLLLAAFAAVTKLEGLTESACVRELIANHITEFAEAKGNNIPPELVLFLKAAIKHRDKSEINPSTKTTKTNTKFGDPADESTSNNM